MFEQPQHWVSSWEKDSRNITKLVDDLLSTSGEVSGVKLSRDILNRYAEMNIDEKKTFFFYLATDLDIEPDLVREALAEYTEDPNRANYERFMLASEPKRQEFIRRLNQVRSATERLVAMRSDLLKFAKEEERLAPVDLDFKHLFSSWFNRGFLVLRAINWNTSANILEKIIQYEAVHEITSWEDLRSRLQPEDRRCFAYFHPSMPDEPLIFVEVGLTKSTPDSIQGLLNEQREIADARAATTAVFYSISNCQSGLAGISFGNFLIKHVVAELSQELPHLKTFVTLSPMPGFSNWLNSSSKRSDDLSNKDYRKLAVHYLLTAKNDKGWPLDPVARFHLGNGASIHAVHIEADTSDKGKKTIAWGYGQLLIRFKIYFHQP